MDDIPLLPEVGDFRALWAHINRIVKQQKRQRAMPSATVRPKQTTVGVSFDAVIPPQQESGGTGATWLP